MTSRASGSFEVSVKPLSAAEEPGGSSLGRLSLDKQFSGDLVAVGKGEMLTAMTPTKGSAAYVAIERVTGTLEGRAGSFVFQHVGIMRGGSQQLTIGVVPDSGTDALSGIAGSFSINITEGKHFYEFDYTLPN
jgi:Protein of unknown function (DUF3224)